ncbi:MAG: hypothetical protein J0H68_01490 [Sphingobacteriia bacterium]|nr:hypothetical protein [Sphingobacteriia bacterium]
MQDSNTELQKIDYLGDLPNETLLNIFQYVDHETIASTAYVSKRLNILYNEWLKNGKIEFNENTIKNYGFFLTYLERNKIKPKYISFKDIQHEYPLFEDFEILHDLEAIELTNVNCNELNFDGLNNLTTLKIDNADWYLNPARLSTLTKLKTLELTSSFHENFKLNYFEKFTDLEELSLNIRNEFLYFLLNSRFALEKLPHPHKLKKLQLSRVKIDENASNTLNLFANLKTLHLSEVIIDKLSFENLSKLETLILHECRGINWQALASCTNLKLLLDETELKNVSSLPILNGVKELHLTNIHNMNNLHLLLEKFPNLITLNLQGLVHQGQAIEGINSNFSVEETIKYLTDKFYKIPVMPSVKNLILSNNHSNSLNNRKEQKLRFKFPNLTSLNYKVPTFGEELFAIEGLNNLEYLSLDLSNISNTYVDSDALLSLKNLKIITINLESSFISDSFISSLATILAKLKTGNVIIDLSEIMHKEVLEREIDEKVAELKQQGYKGFRSEMEKSQTKWCKFL